MKKQILLDTKVQKPTDIILPSRAAWKILTNKTSIGAFEFNDNISCIVSKLVKYNPNILLYGEEKGGEDMGIGKATIITTPHGNTLLPIYRGKKANGVHAVFIGATLVEINIEYTKLPIPKFEIVIDFYLNPVEKECLWIHEINKKEQLETILPLSIMKFYYALSIGIDKVLHHRCRDAYYIAGGNIHDRQI